MPGDPLFTAIMWATGLGILAGPLAIPLLIGAVWGARWSLWMAGSLLLMWGAFGWGLGVAQFAAIDSVEEAEATFYNAIIGANVIVVGCAGLIAWRRRAKGRYP